MSGQTKGTTVRLDIPTVRFTFSSGSSNKTKPIENEEHSSCALNGIGDAAAIFPPPKRKYTKFRVDQVRRRSTRLIPPPPPPVLKPAVASAPSVFVSYFACAICSTSFADGGYSEIRRSTLHTLCAHLNILEHFCTREASDEEEFDSFPLCSNCHELATSVARLNTQLESIYCQISGLLDSIKTAITNVYSLEDKGSAGTSVDEVENVRRFRSLVLQNAGFITTNEISVELMPMHGQEPADDDGFQEDEDISYNLIGLEDQLASQTANERLQSHTDYNSVGGDVSSAFTSITSMSPSPAFSPLSFYNEDFAASATSTQHTSRTEVEKRKTQQISKKRIGRPRKDTGTGRNKVGRPMDDSSKTKLAKIPLTVPHLDRKSYQVFKSLGIEYKRFELKLHKVQVTGKEYTYFDFIQGKTVQCKISSSTFNPWKKLADRSRNKSRIYDVLNSDSGDEEETQKNSVTCLSKVCNMNKMPGKSSYRTASTIHKKTDTDNSHKQNGKLTPRVINTVPDVPEANSCSPQAVPELQSSSSSPKAVPELQSSSSSPKAVPELQSSSSSPKAVPFNRIPVQQTTSGSFLCWFCKKIYKSFSEFMTHVKADHRNRTGSKKPLKKFYGNTEIKVLESGSFKFKCGKCGELASSEKSVINHIKLSHSQKSADNNVLPSKEKLSAILRTVVMKDGRLYYGGQEIIKTKEDNFRCSVCQKIFNRISGIQNHMRLIHNNEAIKKGSINFKPNHSLFKILNTDTEKGYKTYGTFPFHEAKEGQCRCLSSTCKGKWFRSQDHILRHIREVHLKLYPTLQNRTSAKIRIKSIKHDDGRVFHRGTEMIKTEDGKHQCGNCLQILSSVSNLMVHIAKRHNVKQNPFICQYCGKKFAYKFILKKHEEAHESDPSYMCDKCGKSFRFQSNLNHHIREFHNLETRFTCKTCGKKFYGRGDFSRHKETHSNQKPTQPEAPHIQRSTPSPDITYLRSVSNTSPEKSPVNTQIDKSGTVSSESTEIREEALNRSVDSVDESPPPTLFRFDELSSPTKDSLESIESCEPPKLLPCV